MKLKSRKTGYSVVIFLLLLTGLISTAHANPTLNPSGGGFSPTANEFAAYTTTIRATGNVNPAKKFTWTSSGLPAGLSLSISGTNNNTCTISGTPTVSGTNIAFTVTATDRNGPTTGNYTLTINPRCQISGGNTGSISFNIDPTTVGPINNTISQNVLFRCGPGTTYSFSVTPTPKLSGTKNTSGIPFTLTAGQGLAATGLNTTDATLISLLTTSSKVFVADYQGAYAETDTSGNITVTINWTGNGAGSTTARVNASGTVINACSVTGSPALAFGTIDAITNASGKTATVTPPSIKCTMGDAVSVTNDGGLNYSGTPRLNSGTNYINYNLGYTSSLTGLGGTIDIGGSGAGHLAMSASMNAGALNNTPAGTYGDTVTLTISY